MKKLFYLFLLLIFVILINNSQAAICCDNGCFINANCCGADGNGYVGCFDELGQNYCPPQSVFDNTHCPECESCLVCQCSDTETCAWQADDSLCAQGNSCAYDDISTPNATVCLPNQCQTCDECDTGFLDTCSLAECHSCASGSCYFDNILDGECYDCSTANNCNDFNDDKQACNGQITVCDAFSCHWRDLQTDCRQCPNPSAVQCSDFTDQETCNLNPCGGPTCYWSNECMDSPSLKEVSPDPGYLILGSNLEFTVTGEFSDLSTIDITADSLFASNDSSVATISGNTATAVSEGTANITVTFKTNQTSVLLFVGDPNQNPVFCELVEQGTQGNCTQTGDIGCWDPNAVLGEQCCGESQSDNYVNTINHGCTFSSNFGKVVYQTDPDESSEFCGLMSVKMNGVETESCNQESETYCWASSGFILNNGNCCGDDLNEAWNYSTNFLLDNIIVDGTCQNSQWYLRDNNDLTYYNLWTQDLIQ